MTAEIVLNDKSVIQIHMNEPASYVKIKIPLFEQYLSTIIEVDEMEAVVEYLPSVIDLRLALAAARETNKSLNRKLQQAESEVAQLKREFVNKPNGGGTWDSIERKIESRERDSQMEAVESAAKKGRV